MNTGKLATLPGEIERARELFEAAAETTGAAREALLARIGQDDPALGALVEQMLKADDSGHPILDHPLSLATGEPELHDGDHIGSYRVIRRIGSGGMGIVYLTERDGLFAVKVLLWASPEFSQRFLQEQNILSRLRHPNIARLIEGGQTEDKTLFLVMEYVDGLTIHDYCDRLDLPVNPRLELFRQVCAAVSYLHQHLVVHRDLKPGNILVTAEGTAKLVDFGIAKLLPGHQDSSAAAKTLAGLMTPDYASPEQVHGGEISTLTDVYGMGVLLYQLLTGVTPFREPPAELHETLRRVCEDEPLKPSLAAIRQGRNRQWSGALKGELDNIVLKALQKEPPARYASVDQLDRDVERFLNGLPVLAQGDSLAYRAGKFVKRNKISVAAAAIVLLSLGVGIVSTSIQAGIARRERARAEVQAGAADAARQIAEQQALEAERQRGRAERETAEARSQRADAERRLEQLQRTAKGAIEVYASSGRSDLPQTTQALIAGNVRDALLALKRENKLEPSFASLLDAASAQLRSYQVASNADWQIPEGWMAYQTDRNEYRVGVDREFLYQGRPSLFLRSLVANPSGVVGIYQDIDATKYRGSRIRLSGFLRTERVSTRAFLGLTMRVDSELESNRESLSGTTVWKKYEVVVDVPAAAELIQIFVSMNGTGTLWAADFSFEQVGPEVPLSGPQGPQNLNFTQK